MKYLKLAPEHVEKHWHRVAPWIAQSLFESDVAVELEDIRSKAILGHMQIWVCVSEAESVQMVFVTQGFHIDGEEVLVLRMASGTKVDDMLPDFGLLEKWAVNSGFKRLEVWGRPGWTRKLRPLGFRFGYVCLTKELDRGLH